MITPVLLYLLKREELSAWCSITISSRPVEVWCTQFLTCQLNLYDKGLLAQSLCFLIKVLHVSVCAISTRSYCMCVHYTVLVVSGLYFLTQVSRSNSSHSSASLMFPVLLVSYLRSLNLASPFIRVCNMLGLRKVMSSYLHTEDNSLCTNCIIIPSVIIFPTKQRFWDPTIMFTQLHA